MKQTRPGGTTPSSTSGTRRGKGAKWRMPALVGTLVASVAMLSACLERPVCDECHPVSTNMFVETVPQRSVSKIDLLFVIDNSRSMADKQQVLAEAVPDLVRRLVTPDCVDSNGTRSKQDAMGKCAPGAEPEFQPVKDIHIGVVTSSLGGPTCEGMPTKPTDPVKLAAWQREAEERDDRGHLIGTRPRFKADLAKLSGVEPADPQGFLDWNPKAHPGQKEGPFESTFTVMTTSAGETGCGYEAQLESFYRFLIDPRPPEIVKVDDVSHLANKIGVDKALLDQRAAFLRPDSLVAIILLTDENDCSIQDAGQGYQVAVAALNHGSAACAVNPNDPCCYMCARQTPPNGCPADPTCEKPAALDDHDNLRCHAQKKRFGYDFLYPTARYVNALTKRKLCISHPALEGGEEGRCNDEDGVAGPDIYDNPLYVGSAATLARTKDFVFIAGIVGVPWQDLAAEKDPKTNAVYPGAELHYKTAATMESDGTWDKILGNPNPPNGAPPVLPTDRLMVESMDKRTGLDGQKNPLGPSDGLWNANAVNGHEWNNPDRDDLQYACIFDLPLDPATNSRTRDCTKETESCDCEARSPDDKKGPDNNPLCQNPHTNAYGTTQFRAKAYPGLRELEVLKNYGKNSIVASICARNLDRDTLQDYGYRPAVDAIVDRLKDELSDKCLPRELEKDATGEIPCSVVEVLPAAGSPACDPARGRLVPNEDVTAGVKARMRSKGRCDGANQPACSSYRMCELQEVRSERCHQANSDQPEPGWCYIDPANQPGDDPALVKTCPSNERRIMRFVDNERATPAVGAEVFIACFGATGSKPAVTRSQRRRRSSAHRASERFPCWP